MNFKKMMLVVAAAVVLIGGWKYLTRVDRNNPVAVANAFTAAMKKSDTSTASKFFVPEKAEAWRTGMDETLQSMKTGSSERFFERIPSSPEFTAPATVAGKTMIVSADKNFSLEMTQVGGKWYVVKTDFQ